MTPVGDSILMANHIQKKEPMKPQIHPTLSPDPSFHLPTIPQAIAVVPMASRNQSTLLSQIRIAVKSMPLFFCHRLHFLAGMYVYHQPVLVRVSVVDDFDLADFQGTAVDYDQVVLVDEKISEVSEELLDPGYEILVGLVHFAPADPVVQLDPADLREL